LISYRPGSFFPSSVIPFLGTLRGRRFPSGRERPVFHSSPLPYYFLFLSFSQGCPFFLAWNEGTFISRRATKRFFPLFFPGESPWFPRRFAHMSVASLFFPFFSRPPFFQEGINLKEVATAEAILLFSALRPDEKIVFSARCFHVFPPPFSLDDSFLR